MQSVRSPRQLGLLIRNERIRRHLSQQQLADLSGTGQKTISAIENGSEGATLETVFRLLSVLELQISFKPRDVGLGPSMEDIF